MQPSSHNISCLLMLLRACTAEEREQLAALAGTKVNYLYGVAGGSRKQVLARLAFGIEDASEHLHGTTDGRVPRITARDLAMMGRATGFEG